MLLVASLVNDLILYEYGDQIPAETRAKIEKSVLGFRYWWDETGGNSMCYWSENHQILFASAEYVNKKGEVRNVCVGTNARISRRHYLTRRRKTGNFHRQAAVLWASSAMIRLEQTNMLSNRSKY